MIDTSINIEYLDFGILLLFYFLLLLLFYVFSCFVDILIRNWKSMTGCLSAAMLTEKKLIVEGLQHTIYYLIAHPCLISWLLYFHVHQNIRTSPQIYRQMIFNKSTKLTQKEKESHLCKNYFKIAYRCKYKNSKYLKKKYKRMSFNLEKEIFLR